MNSSRKFSDLVWLQTGFIGDSVLTSGAIALARRKFPHMRQHVVTIPGGVGVFEGVEGVSSIVVFDKKQKGFAKWGLTGHGVAAFRHVKDQLRGQVKDFSSAILLQVHRSPRSSLLSKYLGIATINYQETSWGGHAIKRVPRVALWHEVSRIALLLSALDVSRMEILLAKPQLLPLPFEGKYPWESWFNDANTTIIGIAPGSVWGTKRWTSEGFTALIEHLLSNPQNKIVLLGSAAEIEAADKIIGVVGEKKSRLLNLVGLTQLRDLRRIYPRLALLVSNDSSPIHFASAFNVPTVAIFGATIPEMGFAPLAPRSKVLGVELACRPCSDHGPQICPLQHFKCMKELALSRVVKECTDILQTTNKKVSAQELMP